jgi:hypothetical protein
VSHRSRVIPKRQWSDPDYGEYTGALGDPRNDDRDADERYADEVAMAKRARETRAAVHQQRKQQEQQQ